MTRHKAVEILEEVKMIDDSMFTYSQAYNDALDMAIEALKVQDIFVDWLTQERDRRTVAAAAHPKYSSDNMDILHSINVVLDLYNSIKQ